MLVHKFQKSISALLSLALTSTMIPCGAANLVPTNGGKPVITPAIPATKFIVEQKNSPNEFSIQSIESKVKDIIRPQKSVNELQEIYSGKCGDNASWSLNTSTGELTISGTGEMYSYNSKNQPWNKYFNSIKSITIESGITYIGDMTFFGCSSLNSIIVDSNNVNYKSVDGALFTKDGKSLIQYPVGNQATSYSIPNSVTSIEDVAFYGCSNITSVTIPDSVTFIGNNAFYGCSNITSIDVGSSVISIGANAFKSCNALNSINVNSNNAKFKSIDGVLFNEDGKTLIQCPAGNPRTSYKIPETVTVIDNFAFSDCKKLTSITIPNSVTDINRAAFYGCSELTSIIIPNLITNIKPLSFYGCSKLTSVTIPDSVTSISSLAFFGCSKLTSVTIPNSVTSIGSLAFFGCKDLSSITIPSSVALIETSAFSKCEKLSNIDVLGSLSYVKQGAFADCINLKSFTYKGNVAPIYDDNLIDIFSNCSKLNKVSVPEDYKGDNFCGRKTDLKSWWQKNVAWVAPVVTVATAGVCAIIISAITCPNKLKGLISSNCFKSYDNSGDIPVNNDPLIGQM